MRAARRNSGIINRIEQLYPDAYNLEDLSNAIISVYGFDGVKEVIDEVGTKAVLEKLEDSEVPDDVKEIIREYWRK